MIEGEVNGYRVERIEERVRSRVRQGQWRWDLRRESLTKSIELMGRDSWRVLVFSGRKR